MVIDFCYIQKIFLSLDSCLNKFLNIFNYIFEEIALKINPIQNSSLDSA